MTSLCKKSVHSFVGLTNTMDDDSNNWNYNSNFSSSCNKHPGAGDDACRPTSPYNVIESSVFSKLLPSPPRATTTTRSPLFCSPSVFSKKDPGAIGFIDYMGGGVDGLMSCTESLGFESSDERTADDHQMEEMSNQSSSKARWRKDYRHGRGVGGERKEAKKFPPPLSSLNRNGQPSFYLRSVRTDGRLELTEVRIDRPEILRASREGGRLRLHLVREGDEVEEAEEGEESLEEELQDEETLEEEDEKEEEGSVGEWRLQGFRRCNEMMGQHDYHHHQNMSRHHHSHLHVWRQHCVPTR